MLGVQKKTKGYEAASAPLNMLMRARQYGMIQQERQNNIINILGGHSYAM